MNQARDRRGTAGFTLLETLVALAILGVVLSTVFGIFGGGLRAAHRDEDRLLLAMVAQNLLDRSSLDLFPTDGSLSGDIGGGLRWRIDGVPYVLPENLLPPAPELPDQAGREGEASPFADDGADRGGSSGFGGDREQGSSFGGDREQGSSFGGDREQGSSFGGDREQGSSFGSDDQRDSGSSFSRESDQSSAEGGGLGSADGAEEGGLGQGDAERPGERDRRQEREKVRLRLITVTVEKGSERFALSGLVAEPRRERFGDR